MSRRSMVSITVAVGAIAFAAGRVLSDEVTDKRKPSKEEMQRLMEDAARPAPQHEKLATEAGTWDGDCSMFDPSSDKPTLSKATLSAASILGGLWLDQQFNGTHEGKPFEGRMLVGYSKEKQKYFGLWISSMGSTPEVVWGTGDVDGNIVTFDGDPVPCPQGTFTPRWICRRIDADHSTFEHWHKMDGATDYVKGLEVKYTRRR